MGFSGKYPSPLTWLINHSLYNATLSVEVAYSAPSYFKVTNGVKQLFSKCNHCVRGVFRVEVKN